MFKWLKKKIEINNRRNSNDASDWTGAEAWDIGSFIFFWVVYSIPAIACIIISIVCHNFLPLIGTGFCELGHIWQLWHVCCYYGPEYDKPDTVPNKENLE